MRIACLHPTTSEKCVYGDEIHSYSLPFFPLSLVENGRSMGEDDSSKSGKKKSVKDFLKSYKSKKSKMNSQQSDPSSEKENKMDESKLKEQSTQPESASEADTSKASSSSTSKNDPNQLRRKKKPKRSRKEMEDLIKDLRKEKIRESFPPPSNDLPPTVPVTETASMDKKEEVVPLLIPQSIPSIVDSFHSPISASSLPLKKEQITLPPSSPTPRSQPIPDVVDTVSPVYRSPPESPSSPTVPVSILAVGMIGIALFIYKRFN